MSRTNKTYRGQGRWIWPQWPTEIKVVICDAHGYARWFGLIGYTYKLNAQCLSYCRELEIDMVTTTGNVQQQMMIDSFTPFACAWGN